MYFLTTSPCTFKPPPPDLLQCHATHFNIEMSHYSIQILLPCTCNPLTLQTPQAELYPCPSCCNVHTIFPYMAYPLTSIMERRLLWNTNTYLTRLQDVTPLIDISEVTVYWHHLFLPLPLSHTQRWKSFTVRLSQIYNLVLILTGKKYLINNYTTH